MASDFVSLVADQSQMILEYDKTAFKLALAAAPCPPPRGSSPKPLRGTSTCQTLIGGGRIREPLRYRLAAAGLGTSPKSILGHQSVDIGQCDDCVRWTRNATQVGPVTRIELLSHTRTGMIISRRVLDCARSSRVHSGTRSSGDCKQHNSTRQTPVLIDRRDRAKRASRSGLDLEALFSPCLPRTSR